jgi:glycosyltransferase involved in cell wall biosynthesis
VKVAFVSQLPFCLAFGGLEIQLYRTAEALTSAGVEVEFLDPWKMRFDADLLHCFGSEYQLGELLTHAKGRGVPVVVSAVFLPKRAAGLYLAWRLIDRLVPMKTSFGLRRQILRAADVIIALTRTEASHLVHLFGADRGRIHVIGTGVADHFLSATPDEFKAKYQLEDFVLCVASLESRKNQHRLVDAIEGTGLPLVLIGPAHAREPHYARAVLESIRHKHGVLCIDGLPHESSLLASAHAAARVHVLPSLTEGQPAAILEAAATGANLVMSNLPYLRESFGEYAWYCNPRSVHSIRKAVLDAYHAPRGARYTERPPWLISWHDVALRLRNVYEGVVASRS